MPRVGASLNSIHHQPSQSALDPAHACGGSCCQPVSMRQAARNCPQPPGTEASRR